MRQNIRVDIVYYLCDTDFEMEFNLNGCCPMRMLKGSAADRGALVKNLAKAVQRSRVIMCCGPLFGGDGLIGLVAASIGRNTERVNCEEYGIITASDISVIEGSVPLVTPDGYFGGCIIESGPQTIILLSENRNIRKVLMNNLIHPYLEEISMIPDFSQRMKSKMQESANAQSEVSAPVAPVAPANAEIDAEKAAADAAAIVAAALGETAVTTAAEVAETADIIEDISSNSAPAAAETEETPTEEAEEITPADMELQVEEETKPEQLSLDLDEETVEETEEAPADMVVAPVTDEVAEENPDAPVIIGMVPPEDDNLFAKEEIAEESAEEQTEEAAEEVEEQTEEAVEEVTEEVAEEKTEEPVRKGNSLFVAEVMFDRDEMPSEDQFMKTDYNEVELYVEPGAVTRKKMNDYAREYVPSKSDEMFLSGDDDYEYDYDFKSDKKKFSINTPIAILVVLLVLILLVLGYVLIYVPYSQGLDFDQYMSQLFGAAFISPFLK